MRISRSGKIVPIALAVAALLLLPCAATAASLEFLAMWGSQGSENGQFESPSAVAVDAQGNAYVADTFNHRVQVFDPCHRWVATIGSRGSGPGQLNAPLGVAIGPNGDLYVADTNNNRIDVFDPGGSFLFSWGSRGSAAGQFNMPFDVETDSNDNVYVADTGNNRVQVFDPEGNFIVKWGSVGSGDGQFKLARGVATDAAGNVYVADTGNGRVQVFDSAGAFVSKWGSLGEGSGQFQYAAGVATDALGNVYVVESYPNDRVQVFGEPAPTIADVRESVAAAGLPRGTRNSLDAKLAGVQGSLEHGRADVAANKLHAFVAEVEALSGKKLDSETAKGLVTEAEAATGGPGCPG